MSDDQSPSPIIDYFVRKIAASLPSSDQDRLATYKEAISKTTHHGDFRRAWHCADWAIQQSEKPEHSHVGHLVDDIREAHQLWRDSFFGAEFGVMVKDRVGPGQDVEIQWVDDAVAVARAAAERSGWDSVPWEDLVQQMLAVAPPDAAS